MIRDKSKRLITLEKHYLDFADAGLVLPKRYRPEFESVRIRFRRARNNEREAYHAWLEKEFKD